MSIQTSIDGTNVFDERTFTIPANTAKTYSFQASTQFVRVVYVNGGTNQASFVLATKFLSVFGKSPLIIDGVDYKEGNSGIDGSTETIQTINYEHHEIQSGNHYTTCFVKTLGVSTTTNILIITQYFPPDLNGDVIRLLNVMTALKELGYLLTIVTAFPHYPKGEIPLKYRNKLLVMERWKGVDTLAMLRSLRDFGRIESYSLIEEDLNFNIISIKS